MTIRYFAFYVLLSLVTYSSSAAETSNMPELKPLGSFNVPASCSCEFGEIPGETLLYWPQDDSKAAYIREPGGIRKLKLFSEKYLPEKRALAKHGDHQALMFSDGVWHVQAAGEVLRACTPKTRSCLGTELRNRLIVQWEGRERIEIDGWGRCGCSQKP